MGRSGLRQDAVGKPRPGLTEMRSVDNPRPDTVTSMMGLTRTVGHVYLVSSNFTIPLHFIGISFRLLLSLG